MPGETGMEYCLLGPLMVRRNGVVLPVAAGKQRVVLAVLLLRAGRVAGTDELVEALWGSAPPPSARESLQNYVVRLRKALGGEGQGPVVTEPGGYRIEVGPGELDVAVFESAVAAGLGAVRAGSWEQARQVLGEGLALWRGRPLADVPSEGLAAREVPRLQELRWQADEGRIEAEVALGEHARVIADLRALTAEQPLRERLHALLMTALYRDGQQAGALAAYQAARGVLLEELGAEPGPDLRRVHQEVLAGDLVPAGSAGKAPSGPAAGPPATSTGTVPPAPPDAAGAPRLPAGRGRSPGRSRRRRRRDLLIATGSALAIAGAILGWRLPSGPGPADAHAITAGALGARAAVPAQYRGIINRAAELCSAPAVTPALIAAVLKVESNFAATFSSPATASYGIAGWTPAVFRSWEGPPGDDYMKPADAIPAVSRYLCWLDQRFAQAAIHGNRTELLAAGYDTSSKRVIECRSVPPVARTFAESVARYARDFAAAPGPAAPGSQAAILSPAPACATSSP
jgi:DNA-binding SARP family transcriptional activator